MAKSPKTAEQPSAAAPAAPEGAIEVAGRAASPAAPDAPPPASPTEADEADLRVADLGAAALADPAAALTPSAAEVAAAVDGYRIVEANAATARDQALQYRPPVPSDAEIRAAIAEHFGIPEADILAWNVETGRVVTIDGRKLTPEMPGEGA